MAALQMMITDAGLDAIVNAQNGGTDEVLITQIGLTDTPFVMAPTLDALPGEFRRINTVSGQAVAENIIHVVAYDPDPITYDVTGFGLYDAAGTLIAVHSAVADPILSKAALATSLFAVDIVLSSEIADVIEFGDALFLNPPATETTAGVVRLASDADADAGIDDETAMTPAMVQRMIDNALRNKIMIWSGAIVAIPAGWHLCDGTNGTPDLTACFVIGAGGVFAVGDSGGSTNHDHAGTVAGHALTENEVPAHHHLNVVATPGDNALTAGTSLSLERTAGGDTQYILNSAPGEATIGRTSSTGGGFAHNHDVDIAPSDHLPPFYALAYIMKV